MLKFGLSKRIIGDLLLTNNDDIVDVTWGNLGLYAKDVQLIYPKKFMAHLV